MTTLNNNFTVLSSISKWKRPLLIVVLSAVVISSVVSLLIKERFKSFAIVYPSNIISYSSETATEQLLQLFESADIKDGIIKKFNFAQRYNIDTLKIGAHSKLIDIYDDNVSIKKTEYESIEIEVVDTDPVTAFEITNEILALVDQKARSLQRAKTAELVVIARKRFKSKKAEVDSMEVAIKKLRTENGLLDYGTQTKEAMRGYIKTLTNGKTGSAGAKEIENVINNLEAKGGEFISLNEHLFRERGLYNDYKTDYENQLKDMSKELTYTSVVTRPIPADKRFWPKRSVIVLVSTLSAFLFSLFVLSFIELVNSNSNKKESN